jgi:hypothetical protein
MSVGGGGGAAFKYFGSLKKETITFDFWSNEFSLDFLRSLVRYDPLGEKNNNKTKQKKKTHP